MTIPLIILEEHNEAFFLWNYAAGAHWIADRGNALLHVDEHADFSLPFLRRPLESLAGADDLASFTYTDLGIANFIWPAVYLRTLSQIVWLRRFHPLASGHRVALVWSEPADPLSLFYKMVPTPNYARLTKATRTADVFFPHVPDTLDRTFESLILDIDLDFFVSNYGPQADFECEITERAFIGLQNPYDPMRIYLGPSFRAEARDGAYYLVTDKLKAGRESESIARDEIAHRISAFMAFLVRNDIRPSLISICRSSYSGYTPRHLVEFLQEEVIGRLSEGYATRQSHIRELLPESANQQAGWRDARKSVAPRITAEPEFASAAAQAIGTDRWRRNVKKETKAG